jgi:hypothetical protein
MKRKLILGIFALIVLLVNVYIFGYLYIAGTDGYKAATEFLNTDKNLQTSVGENRSYKLAYTGWGISFVGPEGEAHFKIYVNGTKGSGTAFIYLVYQTGLWKIRESNFFPQEGGIIRLYPEETPSRHNS